MADREALSIILVPPGGRESRTIRISRRRLRFGGLLAALVALLLIGMAGSWWYLAARAARTADLEVRVAEMEEDQARIAVFAARLEELELRYAGIRDLFGSDSAAGASELWLPPAASGSSASPTAEDDAVPSSWPLTERGFVTQPLLDGAAGDHPGLDIAVPTDSYVRASGSGTVVEADRDPVYGLYVVIDHGNGYRSRYAHASRLLVEAGARVRRNEVIALTGSTGRSTAPHLHFEILHENRAIDPLTLVQRP